MDDKIIELILIGYTQLVFLIGFGAGIITGRVTSKRKEGD